MVTPLCAHTTLLFRYGVMGSIASVPAGFELETVLTVGAGPVIL